MYQPPAANCVSSRFAAHTRLAQVATVCHDIPTNLLWMQDGVINANTGDAIGHRIMYNVDNGYFDL